MDTENKSRNDQEQQAIEEPSKSNPLKIFFEKFSSTVTKITGRPVAFICAFLMVVIWALCGPVFKYSENWQLVINTSTTIITFLMVFLIQQAQNKDTVALHLKLNELIAANKRASNRLINIEDLTEDELGNLKNFFINLSHNKGNDKDNFTQHSVDEEQLIDTAEDMADKLAEKLEQRKSTKDGDDQD